MLDNVQIDEMLFGLIANYTEYLHRSVRDGVYTYDEALINLDQFVQSLKNA